MVKTTLRIHDDKVYAEVERRAEQEDRSVNWMLNHLLEAGIAATAANEEPS